MRKSVRSLSLLTIAIVLLLPAYAAAENQDAVQIRDVARQQAVAWNRHDAKAYAALFTENCDVVNVVGWWWKGRAELQNKLAAAFSHAFRESTLTITDVQVRFLTPDIALAHAYWTMTGAKMPPGMPEPRVGLQTFVMTRQRGRWLISGFQNTLSRPERPFATKPQIPHLSYAHTQAGNILDTPPSNKKPVLLTHREKRFIEPLNKTCRYSV